MVAPRYRELVRAVWKIDRVCELLREVDGLTDPIRESLDEARLRISLEARAHTGDRRMIECSCGCGATMPDDGLCECGQPVGHQ